MLQPRWRPSILFRSMKSWEIVRGLEKFVKFAAVWLWFEWIALKIVEYYPSCIIFDSVLFTALFPFRHRTINWTGRREFVASHWLRVWIGTNAPNMEDVTHWENAHRPTDAHDTQSGEAAVRKRRRRLAKQRKYHSKDLIKSKPTTQRVWFSHRKRAKIYR